MIEVAVEEAARPGVADRLRIRRMRVEVREILRERGSDRFTRLALGETDEPVAVDR